MRPFLLGVAVVKCVRESANEKRAASAAWIEDYRSPVHSDDTTHEVDDMIRGEGLVLVKLCVNRLNPNTGTNDTIICRSELPVTLNMRICGEMYRYAQDLMNGEYHGKFEGSQL